MGKLIDANVILRYLLNDSEEMAKEAEQVIEAGALTLPEVLAEVVYVLQGVYQIPREEISETVRAFLEEISVENSEVIAYALNLYAEKKIDFVDAILIARARILGDDVFSFDKNSTKF